MCKKHLVDPGIIEELCSGNPIPIQKKGLTYSEIQQQIKEAVAYWDKMHEEKKKPKI
jgi:hypothetical protein